jgi:ADP-heptose:LPS heptosyltransferase
LNIVVTRLQNIGDMLVFIPALRLLRKALPEAHITLLAKHAQGIEIVRRCPYIDEILRIS